MLGLNTFDFIKEFASLELFCGLSRVRGRFVADWFRVSLDLGPVYSGFGSISFNFFRVSSGLFRIYFGSGCSSNSVPLYLFNMR